ncbi:MAG: hypothetical protein KC643_03010 [Nitrospira sp.]|nr:hypothetical protein [Nitrospira sp.]
MLARWAPLLLWLLIFEHGCGKPLLQENQRLENRRQENLFIQATQKSDLAQVTALAPSQGSDAKIVALKIAAQNGDLRLVDVLLATPDFPLEPGLDSAINAGHVAIVRRLLEQGAKPSNRTILAVVNPPMTEQKIKISELFVDRGVKIDKNFIFHAARLGNLKVMEQVVTWGGMSMLKTKPNSLTSRTVLMALRSVPLIGHWALLPCSLL